MDAQSDGRTNSRMDVDLPNQLRSTSGLDSYHLAIVGLVSTACGYLGGTLSVPSHQQAFGELSTTLITNGTVMVRDFNSWATTETAGGSCPAGLMLPGVARTPFNALIYLLLLFWSFLGVAIGADVFMMAIEFITSAETTTKFRVDGGLRSFSVLVWNPTIANLTLMALGSSAPEILLSVIEIVTGGFYAGELGPSTIVGSAAFNLMVISAVCVVSIPEGQSRKIKELPVFYITAFFSIFAYLWLIIILVVITPNIVDIWEGLVTFALFPFLVWLAYLADIKAGCFRGREASGEGSKLVAITREGKPVTADDVSRAYSVVKSAAANDAEVADAVRDLLSGPKSKAFYKITATVTANDGPARKASMGQVQRRSSLDPGAVATIVGGCGTGPARATLSFDTSSVSLPASNGWCELLVRRTNNLEIQCSCQYRVEDMTPTPTKIVPPVTGELVFEAFQEKKFVRFKLSKGSLMYGAHLETPSLTSELGGVTVCAVRVSATLDKGPGMLSFEQEHMSCVESDKHVRVVILRTGGNSRAVACNIKTVDDSAVAPYDYVAVDETLVFAEGETRKEVSIQIIDDGKYENNEVFKVLLSEPTNGASFLSSGDDDTGFSALCEITIVSDEETRNAIDELLANVNFDLDVARQGGADWSVQFAEALQLPDAEEGISFILAFIFYLLALPYKLAFAVAPPPRIMGGWACFCVTLGLIGTLTAFIGDLANHVGCCFGMSASTTAITFVALGTSLPDTFASMTAAKQEPYADASIGNITGSNSVNVFLGLGLPWAIAAIYWAVAGNAAAWHQRYAGEPWYSPDMAVGFAVPAGELGHSVGVFTVCAGATLGSLILRRTREGHELGGKADTKYVMAGLFVFLWFAYLFFSIVG